MTDQSGRKRVPPVGGELAEQFTLDVLKFGVRAFLGQYSQAHLTVEQIRDAVTGDLVYQLRTLILGRQYPDVTETSTKHVRVPASWWQHFKDAYRNRWWLRALVRRRPVVYDHHYGRMTVTVQGVHIWPQAAPALPDYMRQATPLAMTRSVEEVWRVRPDGDEPAP